MIEPKIERTKAGFKVRINNRVELPGIFLNELAARKAIARYNGTKTKPTKKKIS